MLVLAGFDRSMNTDNSSNKRDFDKLYAPLHRSILVGNLSGIAQRDNRFEYNVGNGVGKFVLWPGSGLQKKNAQKHNGHQPNKTESETDKIGLPHWIVAAERLETSRKYLRTAAQIDVHWIEPLAKHLIQRVYLEPHWNSDTGYVHAFEKVSLFGIVLVPKRRINYGTIAPKTARDIFIQAALVEGDLTDGDIITKLDFFVHNQSVLDEAVKMQDKVRQPDMLKPASARYQFYQERIPEEVFDKRSLEKYAKNHPTQHWFMTPDDLCTISPDVSAFPDKLQTFDIKYRYAPGNEDDGLTLLVPQNEIRQLEPSRLGWLVPGLIEQKITALLKSLPKELRRQIVPIPDTVKDMMQRIPFGEGDIEKQVSKEVTRLVGRIVVPTDFNVEKVPKELKMNVRVLDNDGATLKESKDFLSLRKELAPVETIAAERCKPDRDFYTAHRREIKTQVQHLPSVDKLKLYARMLPDFDFHEEIGFLIASRVRESLGMPPNSANIIPATQDVTKLIIPLLENYHQAKLIIEKNKPHPAALEAEEHLQSLTPPGFLSQTDWSDLKEYPRYFRAVPIRFEKLHSGGEAMDQQGMQELKKYRQMYCERLELHELAGIEDAELKTFRWMIEEYRVSLFAQRLGTNIKVSPQRLNKQFEKIRR